MPGAAGATAMNYMVQRAPKDGTTIIYDSWTPLEQVVKAQHVTYDYTKMEFIGALRSGPFMMFARKDSVPGGIASSADFIKAPAIVYGGQQPALILDMHGRLALELLKVKYKYVSGYKGAAEIRLALDRDEVNVTTHGMQGYRSGVEPTLVKAGKAVPLWYFQGRNASGAYVPSDLARGMPAFQDVYREIGGKTSGVELEALELLADLYGSVSNFVWGPPGMDPAALPALRKAFAAAMIDEEFIAEQMKLYGFTHQSVDVGETRRIIERIPSVKPELVAFFKKFVNP
jgi:tripartite-type tricarboxylate transporter receptor subunit TctC